MILLNKKSVFLLILTSVFALNNRAQTTAAAATDAPKRVNFGYSQNPKTKSKIQSGEARANQAANNNVVAISKPIDNAQSDFNDSRREGDFEGGSIARKTLEIAKRASSSANAAPTEIYKIGVGDVLFVSLQNAPAKASTYFTVLNDGTIDYPLAGELVAVANLTTEEVEDVLRDKIKLYANPQISVKVRENASHSISVLGLVEKAGEKFLPREAVPLYVIKAEAVVESRADTVVVKRANGQTETLDLTDAKTDDALVFPGDILEFKSFASAAVSESSAQFYFIGGEIKSDGQKEFHAGLTLTQAILSCGGIKKPGVRRAVIRRKNEQGLLSPIEFDLTAVRDGKQPDPVLQAGDTIELVK